MRNIALDPFILAYPSEIETSAVEFEEYINQLLELKELQDEEQFNYVISSTTYYILTEKNNYPYWDTVKEKLIKHGLQKQFQPRDIIDTLNSLLKNPSIEEKLEIEDILYENVVVNPQNVIEERPGIFVEELYRLLMFLCLALEEGNTYILASKDYSNQKLNVSGSIYEISNNDMKRELPLVYESEISIFNNLNNLFNIIDPIFTWKNAESENDFNLAIEVSIYQRTGKRITNKNWMFGKDFILNVKELGFGHEDIKINMLFKALLDAILQENMGAVHALRTGSGANTPTVTRGTDQACRRDVNREFHLHYWKNKKIIEFANVGVHNTMHITF